MTKEICEFAEQISATIDSSEGYLHTVVISLTSLKYDLFYTSFENYGMHSYNIVSSNKDALSNELRAIYFFDNERYSGLYHTDYGVKSLLKNYERVKAINEFPADNP